MPLLFVYGTLMRNGANHAILRRLDARFVTEATTCAKRTLVDLGPYPALLSEDARALPLALAVPVAVAPASSVSGEVWEVDEHAWVELDAFEGCPTLYHRVRILLDPRSDGARRFEAFVYVLTGAPPAHARVIASGRYACAEENDT